MVDSFDSSALLHFSSYKEGLGGVVRYWEIVRDSGPIVDDGGSLQGGGLGTTGRFTRKQVGRQVKIFK